jgi:hypothetical protein
LRIENSSYTLHLEYPQEIDPYMPVKTRISCVISSIKLPQGKVPADDDASVTYISVDAAIGPPTYSNETGLK